jgi:hypothetical protein
VQVRHGSEGDHQRTDDSEGAQDGRQGEAVRRLDDLPETVIRAESATGLTMSAIARDLGTCVEILDTITFDNDTTLALLEKVCGIADAVSELRTDMECHMRATAHEWAG